MYVIRTLDMFEHQNVGFKHTLSEKGIRTLKRYMILAIYKKLKQISR